VPRILIVESDVHARELARAFLTGAGHAVTLASDGADALAQVAESPPDVVLTEIMVRKVDGLALCKRIKADAATQHIKVVVFSILAAVVRSQEAGADGFLKKPLTERKLVDAVTSALGAHP
jgi:CheY-like chemotaxis protein